MYFVFVLRVIVILLISVPELSWHVCKQPTLVGLCWQIRVTRSRSEMKTRGRRVCIVLCTFQSTLNVS